MAWGLAAILAALLLGAIVWLAVRLRPYWVAKYHGQRANLPGAFLAGAPLRRAELTAADLSRANLHDANLFGAILYVTDLRNADLRGPAWRVASCGEPIRPEPIFGVPI